MARDFPRPINAFADADSGGHDQETKQTIVNGLKLDSFHMFFGELSDLEYAAHYA